MDMISERKIRKWGFLEVINPIFMVKNKMGFFRGKKPHFYGKKIKWGFLEAINPIFMVKKQIGVY